MARTRQKKRVLPVASKELDLVVEDIGGENLQPNQTPTADDGETESDPSPPKQAKVTRKPKTTITKVERTTRASVRKTASRTNINKSDTVFTPPQPVVVVVEPSPLKSIPKVVIPQDLSDDFLPHAHPEIIISRLPENADQISKKSVSIVVPSSPPPPLPPSPPPPEREGMTPLRASRSTNEASETPRNDSVEGDDSTEQVRHYMSPNDALSSTAMYATLGASQSPEILKEPLDDSSSQSTQRASAFFRTINDKSMLHSCNQSDTSETSFGITYYFIESDSDPENAELMEKAYFCLVSRGFSASWLAEKDVVNLPQDNESINYHFVLPSFEGELFENLQSHERWRVFSPFALLNFHSRHLPDRECPIIDVSMERCIVTVSGFPREVRKNMEEKMRLMSAQISSSVKTRTTHIIASSWNTDKCLHTRTHGYPLVMSPRWVEFCWENMREEVIDAFELAYDRVFRLPVFAGFIISGANLSRRGQERLCDLVMQHGGVYENVIDSYRTTHMVTVKREGPNYERAIENERIKIVSPDWIHESIARGYPILEEDYSMKKMLNRMISKMINFVGMGSKTFNDSLAGPERPSTSMDIDILVPGSPEQPESENEDEMALNEEEPNELA